MASKSSEVNIFFKLHIPQRGQWQDNIQALVDKDVRGIRRYLF